MILVSYYKKAISVFRVVILEEEMPMCKYFETGTCHKEKGLPTLYQAINLYICFIF